MMMIAVSTNLDKTLYETALTLEVNTGGHKIKAEQDGKALEVLYRNDKAFLSFSPFGGAVTIR